MKLGLLTRKECWALTLRAKLILLTIAVSFALFLRWGAYSFLALNSPVAGEVLVVEGWIPLHILDQAAAEFKRGSYQRLLLMRARLDDAKQSCEVLDNQADYMAHMLQRLGVPGVKLDTLACYVGEKDRTYQAALGLRSWLARNNKSLSSFNVATAGPHARRSWLMYRKAFGSNADIGILALRDTSYNPDHWWRTTKGFREISWETVAYVYARFFFAWH